MQRILIVDENNPVVLAFTGTLFSIGGLTTIGLVGYFFILMAVVYLVKGKSGGEEIGPAKKLFGWLMVVGFIFFQFYLWMAGNEG